MPAEPVAGIAAADRFFGALPEAAREQLGVELAIIARDVLAAEKRDAPEDTGALSAGLSIALNLDALRVRIGLIGLKSAKRDLYYGIIVEGGRKAQTVVVQRRRRVGGKLRTSNGRKRADDIATTYALHVRARAAVPFVANQSGLADQLVTQRLADFWDGTISKASGA